MKLEVNDKHNKKMERLNKNIKPRLCHDPVFKGIFLRETKALIKMIYDITSFYEFMSFKEAITGYELEPYRLGGKVNKNIDYGTISEVTGKSIEEIKKIENNLVNAC